MNKKITKLAFAIYLFLYSIYSFFTLTLFPYIHSDEPWLAGLSQEYAKKGSTFVTEPFFDLMPRNAHSIKSLFHLLQVFFIKVFGYNIFSVRLMSLLFAIGSLILIFHIFTYLLPNHTLISLSLTILFSLNEQFYYASHLARQEIILFFILVLVVNLYLTRPSNQIIRRIIIPCLLGFSIGFHPNAFILSMMIGLLYLKDIFAGFLSINKKAFYTLLFFIGIIGSFATFYVLLSFLGNSNFIQDYLTYGATLGVDALPSTRFVNFKNFYIKLYYQISGSYYLVDLKGFFIISSSIIVLSIPFLFLKKKRIYEPLLMILSFNIALFIIGRYNPTSILFILLPVYLLLGVILNEISTVFSHQKSNSLFYKTFLFAMIILIIGSGKDHLDLYKTYRNNDYSTYEEQLKSFLSNDSIVLGNLSSGFIFKDSVFYDIRNLAFLDESDSTLFNYLKEREVNMIIYYEEYDYIHRNPEWQILYGEDTAYYDDLQYIITTYGTELGSFSPSIYGTRIIRYMNDYAFKITVYQLELP